MSAYRRVRDCEPVNRLLLQNPKIVCNCGWEVRLGYGVAVTLAIFEVKRFFMLALEMFAEWQVIRFAGGLQPVVFTLADIAVGLPSALMAVRTIRKRKATECRTKIKPVLRCLLSMIVICVAMNVATLISIGCHISIRQESLVEVFNASMRFYVSATSYKRTVDEIQFVFQCCGHTSYDDWFLFDWQRMDYASREEMEQQSRISDEDYRDRGVPFSCCSLRATAPCVHTEMTDVDVGTINEKGCAEVISRVLLRIVVVAYVMTSTLVVTQALLAFLLGKMIGRTPPEKCFSSYSADCKSTGGLLRVLSSETSRNGSVSSLPVTPSPRKRTKRHSKARSKKIKRISPTRCVRGNKENARVVSYCLPHRGFPLAKSTDLTTLGAARIKPSSHEEHRISKRRFIGKTVQMS